jgi:hypothetical protein
MVAGSLQDPTRSAEQKKLVSFGTTSATATMDPWARPIPTEPPQATDGSFGKTRPNALLLRLGMHPPTPSLEHSPAASDSSTASMDLPDQSTRLLTPSLSPQPNAPSTVKLFSDNVTRAPSGDHALSRKRKTEETATALDQGCQLSVKRRRKTGKSKRAVPSTPARGPTVNSQATVQLENRKGPFPRRSGMLLTLTLGEYPQLD